MFSLKTRRLLRWLLPAAALLTAAAVLAALPGLIALPLILHFFPSVFPFKTEKHHPQKNSQGTLTPAVWPAEYIAAVIKLHGIIPQFPEILNMAFNQFHTATSSPAIA